MSRAIADRLRDIVQSADLAVGHATGLDSIGLAVTPRTRDAVLYRIAVIGETASHLPIEIQALAPEIPWSRDKDMRNHIVHGYWQVDLQIVAKTIAIDIEPLKRAANRLIVLIADVNP
jgi:uncharacterized protein with HEPN domain